MLMTGVLVATGVPLRRRPYVTVSPIFARVEEAFVEDVVVASTTVSAAADAWFGDTANTRKRVAMTTPRNTIPERIIFVPLQLAFKNMISNYEIKKRHPLI
jgi:hypothetical protein